MMDIGDNGEQTIVLVNNKSIYLALFVDVILIMNKHLCFCLPNMCPSNSKYDINSQSR